MNDSTYQCDKCGNETFYINPQDGIACCANCGALYEFGFEDEVKEAILQ